MTNAPPRSRDETSAAAESAMTGDGDVTDENPEVDLDADLYSGVDIAAHRIVDAEEAGLGHGLDQAEEARLGITDEEIEAALIERTGLNQD